MNLIEGYNAAQIAAHKGCTVLAQYHDQGPHDWLVFDGLPVEDDRPMRERFLEALGNGGVRHIAVFSGMPDKPWHIDEAAFTQILETARTAPTLPPGDYRIALPAPEGFRYTE